jgi:hypothetical protein
MHFCPCSRNPVESKEGKHTTDDALDDEDSYKRFTCKLYCVSIWKLMGSKGLTGRYESIAYATTTLLTAINLKPCIA